VREELSYQKKNSTTMHCWRKVEFPPNSQTFTRVLFTRERVTAGRVKRAAFGIVSPKGGWKRNYCVGQKVKSELF
jgi:hypothetical protein